MCNARARVNEQLDVQPVGSNWYNARARMDVEGRRELYVESEGSSRYNARGGKSPGKRNFTLSKTITYYECVEVSCL